MTARPDLQRELVCPVCDPDRSSVERTIHGTRDGRLLCRNAVSHLETIGTTADVLLLEPATVPVFRTDGDSQRYHLDRDCRWLAAGQRSTFRPAPIFETNRLEGLRAGRTACHGCCPTEWDSPVIDRAAAAHTDWEAA